MYIISVKIIVKRRNYWKRRQESGVKEEKWNG